MMLPGERARLDVLANVDPDDVPTATLAIALGALPITRDHGPWEAVYGVSFDRSHLDLWLQRLMSVGNRGETEQLLAFTYAGIAAPSMLTIYGASKLFRASPLAFGATAVAIGVGALFVPRSLYAKCWENIKFGFGRLDEALLTPHAQANEELQRELPPFPSWEELVAATSRDAALARACLYRLAGSRRTPATVRELVADLPTLGIGQDAPRVGKVTANFRPSLNRSDRDRFRGRSGDRTAFARSHALETRQRDSELMRKS